MALNVQGTTHPARPRFLSIDVRRSEASLKRLQTDHVDLVHIHSLGQADDLEKMFGFVITLIGCYLGLATRGGAEGVGRATTRTVVYSAEMILVLDAYWAVTLLRAS